MLRGTRKIHGCAHTGKFVCLYLNYNYKGVKKVFSEKILNTPNTESMMLNCYSNAVWGFLEGEINIKSKCEKFNKKKC